MIGFVRRSLVDLSHVLDWITQAKQSYGQNWNMGAFLARLIVHGSCCNRILLDEMQDRLQHVTAPILLPPQPGVYFEFILTGR